jgi:hypothetical protein
LQFCDGLNNEATRGGLKNQVADLKERCSQGIPVTVTEVFRRCDALISTDCGTENYENKDKQSWTPTSKGKGKKNIPLQPHLFNALPSDRNSKSPNGNRKLKPVEPESSANESVENGSETEESVEEESDADESEESDSIADEYNSDAKDSHESDSDAEESPAESKSKRKRKARMVKMECWRCGKLGHPEHLCYSKKHKDGSVLTTNESPSEAEEGEKSESPSEAEEGDIPENTVHMMADDTSENSDTSQ